MDAEDGAAQPVAVARRRQPGDQAKRMQTAYRVRRHAERHQDRSAEAQFMQQWRASACVTDAVLTALSLQVAHSACHEAVEMFRRLAYCVRVCNISKCLSCSSRNV